MIGISLVGVGYWGPKLARNLRSNSSVDIRFLFDVDRSAAERLAVGPELVASEFDEVLSDSETDAIVIATPPSTHFELVMAALDHGKHVMVEKPLTRTLREADELVAAVERTGLVLMVGHTYLFNDPVRHLREVVASGRLGPVHYLTSVRTNLGPIRTDVGAAFDLASHDVAISAFLFDAFPTTVSATGGSWVTQGVHDSVVGSLFFPGNRIAHLQASWLHPRKERRIVVVGDLGMLMFDDLDEHRPIEFFEKGVASTDTGRPSDTSPPSFRVGDIHAPFITTREPLAQELDAFVSAVQGVRPFVSGVRFGRDVVAVLEAMERSMAADGSPSEVHYAG